MNQTQLLPLRDTRWTAEN